ncbi:hypothetical protein TrVE_jg10017 [Triparma verrucosa]|uniref:Uncharacterized protein n=2 Tax=Triparma TaxID=722752 RepID=A0A9W7BTY7_9STRA|nr:hypothetical protein TrST_g4061 [Triparma strigata]GMI15308.1 hypothetical protein TrVE_jg10017 [Triparma verrucosa]
MEEQTPAAKAIPAAAAGKKSSTKKRYVQKKQKLPFSTSSLHFLVSTLKASAETYMSTRLTSQGQKLKLEALLDTLLNKVRKRIVTTEDGGTLECPKLALRPSAPISKLGMANVGAGYKPRKGETFGYVGLSEENARIAAIVESLEKECESFGGGVVGQKRRLEEDAERKEIRQKLLDIQDEFSKAPPSSLLPPSVLGPKLSSITSLASSAASRLNDSEVGVKKSGKRKLVTRTPATNILKRDIGTVDVKKRVKVIRGMESIVKNISNK